VIDLCILIIQRILQVERAEHEDGGEAQRILFLIFRNMANCEIPVLEGEIRAPVKGLFLPIAEGPDDVVVAG